MEAPIPYEKAEKLCRLNGMDQEFYLMTL